MECLVSVTFGSEGAQEGLMTSLTSYYFLQGLTTIFMLLFLSVEHIKR